MIARKVLAGIGWAAAGAVLLRGVTGAWNAHQSLQWLRDTTPTPGGPRNDKDHILFVLPMLREQRLLGETVAYFQALADSWGSATVAVVTSEREHVERREAAGLTADLAARLRRRCDAGYLAGRYLYVHLAVPHEVAEQRQRARGPVVAHLMDPAVRAAIDGACLAWLSLLPAGRSLILDGRQPADVLCELVIRTLHQQPATPSPRWAALHAYRCQSGVR